MRVSEIDDCSICPLMEEGICRGITGGPNGYVEPPCASWDEDEDTDDIIEMYYAYEAYRVEEERKEQKKKREANEKSAKSAYMRMMTRSTTSKIKELKKKIASVEDVKFRVSSMSRAFSIVDSMFNGGNASNASNAECDLSQYDKFIDDYKAVLTKTELELKEEREKVRKSIGYRRAGLERKPNWGSVFGGVYWYENVIDYVSVKTDKLMEECMGTLNKFGLGEYLIVFIAINGKYHMYGYNGNWVELGYLDDLNVKSRIDTEF